MDVPEVFEEYLAAWRSADEATIRLHVDRSLATSIVWCDPNYNIEGRDAVVEMIVEFHKLVPDAGLSLTTKVDSHHDRHRYDWLVTSGGRSVMRGTDVVMVNGDGLISRIDGFFGRLEPLS